MDGTLRKVDARSLQYDFSIFSTRLGTYSHVSTKKSSLETVLDVILYDDAFHVVGRRVSIMTTGRAASSANPFVFPAVVSEFWYLRA